MVSAIMSGSVSLGLYGRPVWIKANQMIWVLKGFNIDLMEKLYLIFWKLELASHSPAILFSIWANYPLCVSVWWYMSFCCYSSNAGYHSQSFSGLHQSAVMADASGVTWLSPGQLCLSWLDFLNVWGLAGFSWLRQRGSGWLGSAPCALPPLAG